MKEYSVKDISELLHTNPETVRRWIRDGKLKAHQSSRKKGNVIYEDDLKRFFDTSKKYSDIAKSGAAAVGAAAVGALLGPMGLISSGALIAGTLGSMAAQKKDGKLTKKTVIASLKTKIADNESEIQRKNKAISDLEADIEKLKQENDSYQELLDNMTSKNISEPDVSETKEDVNQ